jgi:hypothetical protein
MIVEFLEDADTMAYGKVKAAKSLSVTTLDGLAFVERGVAVEKKGNTKKKKEVK